MALNVLQTIFIEFSPASACHREFATMEKTLAFHYSNSLKWNKYVFEREIPASERLAKDAIDTGRWQGDELAAWDARILHAIETKLPFSFASLRCWLRELTNFYDVTFRQKKQKKSGSNVSHR